MNRRTVFSCSIMSANNSKQVVCEGMSVARLYYFFSSFYFYLYSSPLSRSLSEKLPTTSLTLCLCHIYTQAECQLCCWQTTTVNNLHVTAYTWLIESCAYPPYCKLACLLAYLPYCLLVSVVRPTCLLSVGQRVQPERMFARSFAFSSVYLCQFFSRSLASRRSSSVNNNNHNGYG